MSELQIWILLLIIYRLNAYVYTITMVNISRSYQYNYIKVILLANGMDFFLDVYNYFFILIYDNQNNILVIQPVNGFSISENFWRTNYVDFKSELQIWILLLIIYRLNEYVYIIEMVKYHTSGERLQCF